MKLILLTKSKDLDNRFESKQDIKVVYKADVQENIFRPDYCDRFMNISPEAILINRYIDPTEDMSNLLNLLNELRDKFSHVKPLILLGDDNETEIKILASSGYFNVLRRSEAKSTNVIIHKLTKPQDMFEEKEEVEEAVPVLKLSLGTTRTEFRAKQIIAVTSPLSQGASFIAWNMAKQLSKEKYIKVCLLEWNAYKPMLKRELRKKTKKSYKDVFEAYDSKQLTIERLEHMLTRVEKVDILFASPNIMDYHHYKSDIDKPVLESLKMLHTLYDYIIIDTHSCPDLDLTRIAMQSADRTLLVTRSSSFDLEHINSMLKNFMDYRHVDHNKIEVVVNDLGPMDPTEVEIKSQLIVEPASIIRKQSSKKNVFQKFRDKELERDLKKLALKM